MSTSSSLPFSGGNSVHVSFNEIRDATDNFNESYVLGKGGEATVYLAKLKLGPDQEIIQEVAVKHLKSNSEEFDQEINIISKTQHPNLVSLLGYCNEAGHKILIYEYMENGNLSNFVKAKNRIFLSWLQRLRICLDVARGLKYLHTETDEFPKGIIHRDVKPENILLGKDWVAKISDFGMFKVSDVGQLKSTMNTNLKGTGGYYAPEYLTYRNVTRKIDVYALGVVLFQVLCAKMPWDRGDTSYNSTDDEDLGIWAQQNVDSKIKAEISDHSLKKFTSIIGKSLKKDPRKRPTMNAVVLELEKVLSLQSKEGDDKAMQGRAATFMDSDVGHLNVKAKTSVGFFKKFKTVIEKTLKKDPGKLHNASSTDGVVVGIGKLLNHETRDEEARQDQSATEPNNHSSGHRHLTLRLLTSRYAFNLEDLFRGNAEVLGKGTFGATYKTILENGTTVVVKRLKGVSVEKEEFEELMEMVGSIKHENVIELIAYYYSRDEKLTLYDYYKSGSVHEMLHGNREEARGPLSWESRLRIAIGASRGVARIHAENGGKLVHGNIKSSNIFPNPQQYGCISDLGLPSIISPIACTAGGYWAPEVTDTRKATQASDVYSIGLLLLELITGKSPVLIIGGDEGKDLVSWVNLMVKEEWTAEVFDMELLRYSNKEEEMVMMLQIAMSCVTREVDRRPKISEVVIMIEDVARVDSENSMSS